MSGRLVSYSSIMNEHDIALSILDEYETVLRAVNTPLNDVETERLGCVRYYLTWHVVSPAHAFALLKWAPSDPWWNLFRTRMCARNE